MSFFRVTLYSFVFLFISIFLITNVLGQDSSTSSTSLGDFEPGECVVLKQLCANCTFVNITSIVYPNKTIDLNVKGMTKIGTEYNYTLCSTQTTGRYVVNGNGNPSGILTVFAFDFNIRYPGNVWLFLFLVGLGILVLLFAFLMENEWLGFVSGVLFIVAGVYIMIYGLVGLASLYTRAIGYALIGLGLLFEIAAGYKVAEEARGFNSSG